MINLIVAYDKNRLIGNGDKLPWPSIKEDFKHFKETTLECPIVMGRKTWDSLPKKPLPTRHNIVLSRTATGIDFDPNNWMTWFTKIEIVKAMSAVSTKPLYVIGGAEIYKLFLDDGLVDKIIASEIDGEYEGDVYFPEINKDHWDTKVVKEFPQFKVVEYSKRK